jgi:50S ribosomal subunit-associated GTPase HflX
MAKENSPVVFISALKNENIDELKAKIIDLLPLA